jgi:hypothetical protein
VSDTVLISTSLENVECKLLMCRQLRRRSTKPPIIAISVAAVAILPERNVNSGLEGAHRPIIW